jgi:hypothetical protein
VKVRDVLDGVDAFNTRGVTARRGGPSISGDGRWLAQVINYETRLLDLHTGKPGAVLRTGVGFEQPVVVSRDGRLAAGISTHGIGKQVALYDTRTGRWTASPHHFSPGSQLRQMLFSPDGKRLAIVSDVTETPGSPIREGRVKIVEVQPDTQRAGPRRRP